ncbi:DUF1287 domain-containing protein [Haoranjiania flava]|uniref:DUF1287 domain-containing protein n=1 Tax=Haoranjiania flava TaxID=1856322 RepID=A0AAE3IL77_9BACT|nr:DUF1287 domain-containing protein [Haoranjiania flava]MCU7694255.1 DUF1287 domain-containing protein [Haoranjiania flava]
MRSFLLLLLIVVVLLSAAVFYRKLPAWQQPAIAIQEATKEEKELPLHGFRKKLSDAAISIIDNTIIYDGSYYSIGYPGGDVDARKGVCTDVIVRSYRKLGIDLQELVHKDMQSNFAKYPQMWGRRSPDTNIDHRRVPNLARFFERHGESYAATHNAEDYRPGDIVTWILSNNLTHIGVVVNKKSADQKRFLVVHNIGGGQVLADCLFAYKLTGHYYYDGSKKPD